MKQYRLANYLDDHTLPKRLSFLCFVFSYLVLPAVAVAQSQLVSMPDRSYSVIVSKLQWRSKDVGTADLVFTFNVRGADGSPLQFNPSANAVFPIRLSAWTNGNYTSPVSHAGSITLAANNQDFYADIPGLDPNEKNAHIEFDILDPSSGPIQKTSLVSSMVFDNVPLPNALDVAEPVAFSYTTPWGTILTFKSVTLVSKGNGGVGSVRYTFGVDRAKILDDRLQIRLADASDGGISIPGVATTVASAAGLKGTINSTSGFIAPGTHKSAHLEFRVNESAQSPAVGANWIPIELNEEIDSLPRPLTNRRVNGQTYFADKNIQYTMMDVSNPAANKYEYLFYIKSPIPGAQWVYTDAGWADPTVPALHFANFTSDVLWHIDGSPLAPGETGARFISTGRVRTYFPLEVTVSPVTFNQAAFTFSDVTVPAPGQFTLVNQPPTGLTNSPLRLRYIKSLLPEGDPDAAPAPTLLNTPYTLQLEFTYEAPPNALVSLALISSRDKENNALSPCEQSVIPPDLSPIAEGGAKRVFYAEVSIPPHGSKTITLKLIGTTETPTTLPTRLTIDNTGNWRLENNPKF